MYFHGHISLCMVLAVLGLAFGEEAGAKQANKTTTSTAAHASTTVLAQVLHELHQARRLLHDGVHVAHAHRARAEAEINQAIHLLEQHPHHKKGEGAKTPAKHSKAPHAKAPHAMAAHPEGPVTQAQLSSADTRLRQSEKMVRAAMHQLHQLHTQSGGAHAHADKASHLLKQASHEIQAALHAVHALEKHQATAVAKNP